MTEITDEMVQEACDVYSEVYASDDKDMGDAMRAALELCIDTLGAVQKAYSCPDSPIINLSVEKARNALRLSPVPAEWQLQLSTPNDGFECYYLFRDGVRVAEICGPQTEERTRALQELVTKVTSEWDRAFLRGIEHAHTGGARLSWGEDGNPDRDKLDQAITDQRRATGEQT